MNKKKASVKHSSAFKYMERLKEKHLLLLPLKNIIFLVGIICLGIACDLDVETDVAPIEQEQYELFFSYSPSADLYMRKHLIDHFQSIALASEYGQNLPILKKWMKPMSIYVSGDTVPELRVELEEIIVELNALFTDGFSIQIVEDSLASNFHIFLGAKTTYSQMYPGTSTLLRENEGLFTNQLNTDFSIESGHMFVSIHDIPLRYQKHILREELTQSLGLPNDIDIYANSIFYKKWSDIQAYSNLDIEVIRLLYHPRMRPNIGPASVSTILADILGV